MDKKLVFVARHYKKGWLSIDYFLFDIHRFILININRNIGQKSWEHILRTFILQATCEWFQLVSNGSNNWFQMVQTITNDVSYS